MRKLFFLAFIFVAACSGQSPQVTVTSEVTATLTPTKVPTETPTPTVTSLPSEMTEVEAPTPEQLWEQEVVEWALSPDDYSEKHDVDGNLAIVKNSTKEVVYWVDADRVGYWNLQVMRKMIMETQVKDKACYPTRWAGTIGKSVPPKEDAESYDRNFARPFFDKVRKKVIELEIMKDYPMGISEFLGGDSNCWVDIRVKHFVQSPDDLATNYIFWLNGDKELQYEQAFSPKMMKIVLANE